MRSITTLAAIALVGLVLVMMPTGPTYAGQTPVATGNTPLITDTVVSTGALLPISPVHWRGYRGGYYRGYSGGYWPGITEGTIRTIRGIMDTILAITLTTAIPATVGGTEGSSIVARRTSSGG